MYIKRKLENTVLKYLDRKEIIAIIGPRQSGKTTMVNNIIKDLDACSVVSFDDIKILKMFERETDDFIKIYVKRKKFLFIDEFQYAKQGGKILKYIYDKEKIKIIISGSSAPDISIQAIKYLVGRVLVFSLHPLDFSEFLSVRSKEYCRYYTDNRENIFADNKKIEIGQTAHQALLKYYEEYLIYGGYPSVVLEKDEEIKIVLLNNIFNTYFLREVKDILGLVDDYMLGNLIKALALQIGSMVEYSELSKVSGFTFLTLKKYLNFLDKTFICRFARPYYQNRRNEIVKASKVYFIDTGLRNSVLDDFRTLDKRTDKGALVENGLAMQFMKAEIDFQFWRDKNKNEMDFILPLGGGKMAGVESKSRLHATTASLNNFKARYPEIKTFISYTDIDNKKDIANTRPVYLF